MCYESYRCDVGNIARLRCTDLHHSAAFVEDKNQVFYLSDESLTINNKNNKNNKNNINKTTYIDRDGVGQVALRQYFKRAESDNVRRSTVRLRIILRGDKTVDVRIQ